MQRYITLLAKVCITSKATARESWIALTITKREIKSNDGSQPINDSNWQLKDNC